MPNRLATEKSPYLRQHADQPVDWYPWGAEALAKAQSENKPIFLSIGYSTCHWCHVMAHESFDNAAVAAVLNRDFVPVKVDREERPDLDRVYMTYIQQTTGHGGWPMSVWLTPTGKPFFGGTYFAPDNRHGRPGFIAVLNAITGHWQTQRESILTGADEMVAALQRYADEGPAREVGIDDAAKPLHEVAGDAFEQGYQYFYENYDEQWGGFGGAPKFPRASVLHFLFRIAALQGVESELGASAVKLATHTLQKMAEGGMHDHLGGGFHRYAVDEQWHVPHFEKMLSDQALIAVNYLEAKQATGREVFAWLARDIFDYVARELTSSQGGFYSAQDADSPVGGEQEAVNSRHAEGVFYAWTRAEVEQVLGDDAAFFCAHFDVRAEGNVAHDPQGEFTGKNILRQSQSLVVTARGFGLEIEAASERLLRCLEKMRIARGRRPHPALDDKIITAWNGLMISALAKGARVLGGEAGEQERWLRMATRAAEFIRHELYDADTGTLYRSWREGRSDIPGFAEDYAYLIQGLLDLYEAGFELRWLQWAEHLQAKMDAFFWDKKGGGYFNSRGDDPIVIVRLKENYDGAEPAPNSVAIMNLMRLEWMIGTDTTSYRQKALNTVIALQPQWSRSPQAMPQLLGALELVLGEPRTAVLAGEPRTTGFTALAAVLAERLGPYRAAVALTGEEARLWLGARRPYLRTFLWSAERASVALCENRTCQPLVSDAAALRGLLSQ